MSLATRLIPNLQRLMLTLWAIALISCNSVKCTNSGAGRGASAIRLSDGVDAREAEMLIHAYFFRYEGGCGGSGPVVRDGADWTAEIRVGYAGTTGQTIRVDCTSGVVRQSGHPTCHPPWTVIAEYIITPEEARSQSTGVLTPLGT